MLPVFESVISLLMFAIEAPNVEGFSEAPILPLRRQWMRSRLGYRREKARKLGVGAETPRRPPVGRECSQVEGLNRERSPYCGTAPVSDSEVVNHE